MRWPSAARGRRPIRAEEKLCAKSFRRASGKQQLCRLAFPLTLLAQIVEQAAHLVFDRKLFLAVLRCGCCRGSGRLGRGSDGMQRDVLIAKAYGLLLSPVVPRRDGWSGRRGRRRLPPLSRGLFNE